MRGASLPAPAMPRGRLSGPTRLLHWGVALGIAGMLACGFWQGSLPEGPARGAAIRAHKSFGILVLGLALARALWRRREGFPVPAGATPPAARRVARTVHAALIGASLLMPASGIARSLAYPRPVSAFGLPLLPRLFETRPEGLYRAAAALHDWLAILFVGLIALHVAAALKHHLLDRDDTLRRMIGDRR